MLGSKTLFIIPTDAHCYKSVEMLKQIKVITLAPACFGSRRNHHQGAVLCLAKTTDMVFPVLVDMDSVNAMAAYSIVEQVCVHGGERKELTFSTVNARLLNRPICRHSTE
jgi:hypothetical protein